MTSPWCFHLVANPLKPIHGIWFESGVFPAVEELSSVDRGNQQQAGFHLACSMTSSLVEGLLAIFCEVWYVSSMINRFTRSSVFPFAYSHKQKWERQIFDQQIVPPMGRWGEGQVERSEQGIQDLEISHAELRRAQSESIFILNDLYCGIYWTQRFTGFREKEERKTHILKYSSFSPSNKHKWDVPLVAFFEIWLLCPGILIWK